jgi:4-alpha-glucanotransferase
MDILERATRLGVDTQYWTAFGELRKVAPEVLQRLVGVLAKTDRHDTRLLPASIVVRGDEPPELRLSAPEGVSFRWHIGGVDALAQGQATSPTLRLPGQLPQGIWQLRVTLEDPGRRQQEDSCLLVSPPQAYQGEPHWPQRMWALAVQLYAVRSNRNWGHGDFSDLLALVELAADLGACGIGLNPLHALFDDRAEETSPYYPSSRFFLNPLYIAVEALPEFPGVEAAGLDGDIERLRNSSMLDYEGIAKAKFAGLALAYETFREQGTAERLAEFDCFRQSQPLPLQAFACFEVLRRRFTQPWWEWPQEWRRPSQASLSEYARSEAKAVQFYEYTQWAAHSQLKQCQERARARGMPVGLYLDLAVGVRSDGFDAWCDQEAVLSETAVGAPPDALNAAGQNWGLAGFNPVALEERAFKPFEWLLNASMAHAGAIRLDHVLGLQRLFLIPKGVPARDGTYIRMPFTGLLAVTALTSMQNRCLVIGEDLGTVPQNFRETLAKWGIWSYQVMIFERSAGGEFISPDHYRENALVTFATHDLPTFVGWRDHHDLAIKKELNMDAGETEGARNHAVDLLRTALRRQGSEAMEFSSVAKYLAATPARLMVISMEDVLGVKDQVNLPGTLKEHPNWRRPLPVLLENLGNHENVLTVAEIMRAAGRSWH